MLCRPVRHARKKLFSDVQSKNTRIITNRKRVSFNSNRWPRRTYVIPANAHRRKLPFRKGKKYICEHNSADRIPDVWLAHRFTAHRWLDFQAPASPKEKRETKIYRVSKRNAERNDSLHYNFHVMARISITCFHVAREREYFYHSKCWRKCNQQGCCLLNILAQITTPRIALYYISVMCNRFGKYWYFGIIMFGWDDDMNDGGGGSHGGRIDGSHVRGKKIVFLPFVLEWNE